MDNEPDASNVHNLRVTKAKITAFAEVHDEDPDNNPLGFTLHVSPLSNI